MRVLPRFFYDTNTAETSGGNGTEKTQEAIDKENEVKARLGIEPLQPETTPAKTNLELSPAEMEAANVEAEAQKLVLARAAQIEQEQATERERLRLEQIQKNNPPEPVVKITKAAPVVKLDEPPAKTDEEIEDEKLLEAISKRTGKKVTSFDEVLNPKKDETIIEDSVLSEQERENAMVAFALNNKRISKKEIESFISDTKDLQSVAYNFFAENLKELEPELTDKQIKERFEEKYAINEDEDSKEFKLGQREMNFVANTIIKQKHEKYLGLSNEYSSFEQAQLAEKTRQASILQKAPQFRRDIEEVTKRLSKFKVAGYDVELGDDILQEYRDEVLTSAHSDKIIEKGYSLDGLEKAFKDRILTDNFDSIVEKVLEVDRLKNQAGTRGIIPDKNHQKQKVYTDQQVKQEEELQKRLQNANAGALN